MNRQKQNKTNLTKANLTRILTWGKLMMSEPKHRWIADDTNTIGKIADEIRRLNHLDYKLQNKRIVRKRK